MTDYCRGVPLTVSTSNRNSETSADKMNYLRKHSKVRNLQTKYVCYIYQKFLKCKFEIKLSKKNHQYFFTTFLQQLDFRKETRQQVVLNFIWLLLSITAKPHPKPAQR